jgi:hypothetical protein
VEVGAARVLSGDVSAGEAGRPRSGELLAGLAFDDEPGFDNWLLPGPTCSTTRCTSSPSRST